MASDIEGNVLNMGDHVYIMAPAKGGSQSMRLLYGEVVETTEAKVMVMVYENGKTYSKTSATVVKPYG